MNNCLKMLPPISENERGELYSLTSEQLLKVKKLIRKECCNYNAELGECFLLNGGRGCICPQMISNHIICRWFNHAVLPQDPSLYVDVIKDTECKRCVVCGTAIFPRGNKTKYCPKCRKKVWRKQRTEWQRKYRSVVEK